MGEIAGPIPAVCSITMEYLVGDKRFSFSYQGLFEDYVRYSRMNDAEFLENIVPILHFTCFVCYLKEIPTGCCLVDNGIIHQLVHLLQEETRPQALRELEDIRDTFNKVCELV